MQRWEKTKRNKIFTPLGASNHSLKEREENDYYATDPKALELLLELEHFSDNVWECACGGGHLSEVLKKHGHHVKSTDIIDRGYIGTEIRDFLAVKREELVTDIPRDIITNPPYKLGKEFVEHANCMDVFNGIIKENENVVVVSDPPFNIGYHYNKYSDSMVDAEYYKMLVSLFGQTPSVVIHYPEALHRLSVEMGICPERVVSWVYNSNTARQHRDIAFYDVKPNFNAVRQPYKNLNDKRIQKRIAEGKTGAKLYDWWNINQVKNVSKDKTAHPCQMPLEVMKNIVGILPEDAVIIDPFMGSGTTGVACAELGRKFIGIEVDADYFRIAEQRITAAYADKESVL